MQCLKTFLRASAHSAAVLPLIAFLSGSANAASDPTGVWINDTGRGAIEIKYCGKNLCGHVVWVKDDSDTKGCGKQIIGDAESVGSGTWDNGWIYSPERKKTYDVELKPLSNGTLRVTGYAGVKFLSKTMIWTRAPADLKRCAPTSVEASADTKAASPESAGSAAKSETAPPTVAAAGTAASSASSNATSPAPAKEAETTAPAAATSDSAKTAAADPAPAREAAPSSDAIKSDTQNDKAAPKEKTDGEKVAQADPGDEDAKPPKRSKSRLNLGDLGLDKVLTHTSPGRCKLDLPFVKVRFNCDN